MASAQFGNLDSFNVIEPTFTIKVQCINDTNSTATVVVTCADGQHPKPTGNTITTTVPPGFNDVVPIAFSHDDGLAIKAQIVLSMSNSDGLLDSDSAIFVFVFPGCGNHGENKYEIFKDQSAGSLKVRVPNFTSDKNLDPATKDLKPVAAYLHVMRKNRSESRRVLVDDEPKVIKVDISKKKSGDMIEFVGIPVLRNRKGETHPVGFAKVVWVGKKDDGSPETVFGMTSHHLTDKYPI